MKLLDNLGLSRFLHNCDNRFAKKEHTHSDSGGLAPVELVRFDVGDPDTYFYAIDDPGYYTATVKITDAEYTRDKVFYCTMSLAFDEALIDTTNPNIYQSSAVVEINRSPNSDTTRICLAVMAGDLMDDGNILKLICVNITNGNGGAYEIVKLYKQEVSQ